MLHVAHEAPKNVLIAEHYSHEDWEKSYASYEGLTEVGWFLGLLLGLLVSTFSLSAHYTLFLCSGLNLAAFVLSIFLVADPLLIFERRLVNIEKKIDFTYRGFGVASQILDGFSPSEKLQEESFLAFGIALVFFSLASSIFFTPLPIFFSEKLAFSNSMVFMVYMLNSGGGVMGYFVASRRSAFSDAKAQMRRIVLFRSALIFMLVIVVQVAVSTQLLAGIIFVSLGFAYAVYYVLMLSLSMSLMPPGRTGVFDVMVGLGAVSGSFLGPFLAEALGYLPGFLIAGALFLSAFAILRIFT
jgi:hypothetical protein